MAKTATKRRAPTYDKFLTQEQARYILNAISRGYNDRDDYPPFALVSFEDRPRFSQYIGRVINEMVK